MSSNDCGLGAPASAAEAGIETRERGLDTKPDLPEQDARVLQHAKLRTISAHIAEQETTSDQALGIGTLAPDPMLDAAYRSGIVPPAQRIRTTTADVETVVTFFPDRHALSKTEMILPLGSLVESIRTTCAPQKEGLPLLKLALLGNGRTDKGCVRFDANIAAISGVETDYDGEQVGIDRAIETAASVGLLCIIYTSPSHTPAKPRWRILAPTSREQPPKEREHLLARINGLYGGIFAPESWTLSQAYYFGSVGNKAHRVELIEGRPIDLLDWLDRIAIAKPGLEKRTPSAKPVKPATGLSPYAEAALDKACRNIITAAAGEQERTLNAEAFAIGTLAGAGAIPADFARRALVWAACQIRNYDPRRPWRPAEIVHKVERAFAAGMRRPREARRG
jgi:hypothetical protein